MNPTAIRDFLKGLDATRLTALAQASSDIVFITDARGFIRDFDPIFTRASGTGWEAYRGEGWRDAVHPDDREKLAGLLNDGEHHTIDVRIRKPGETDWTWFRLHFVPLAERDGSIREWMGSLTDIHEAVLAREARELLLGELRHRMKNLMTIIEALAKTARRGKEPAVEEYLARFLGRLHTLSTTADMALAGGRVFIEMGAMVRETMEPFVGDDKSRVCIDGPAVRLSEQTGCTMALAVHELATNAIKYGALSVPDGKVTITWKTAKVQNGEAVTFEWVETGGPRPVAPEKLGFGMRVIKAAALREKSGDVVIEYRPGGLYCRIDFVRSDIRPVSPSARLANSATVL